MFAKGVEVGEGRTGHVGLAHANYYIQSGSILLLRTYLGKPLIQKDTCTPMLTKALFTTARICKQHKCPSVDEWIEKIWYRLPWWSSGQDSALSMQEAGGRSLVEELDPTCHN